MSQLYLTCSFAAALCSAIKARMYGGVGRGLVGDDAGSESIWFVFVGSTGTRLRKQWAPRIL